MRALGVELTRDEVRVILTQLHKDPDSLSSSASPSSLSSSQNWASIRITLDEFITIMSTRLSFRDSKEEIAQIFQLFDEEKTGFITFRSLKRVCQELGENLKDEEIQEMIDEADKDQDGKINLEEFYRIMRKRFVSSSERIREMFVFSHSSFLAS